MKLRILFFSLAMFVVFICLAATVAPGKKIRDYPNTATLNSNDAFVVELGDGSTNKNIRYGQLAKIVTNGINASLTNTMKTFASNLVVVLSGTNILVSKTSTNGTNFYVVNADPFAITNGLATTNYANQVASNRVVVLSGTNTSVFLTSTNGTNFYQVNTPSSAGFAALEIQTNTVRLGLVTNVNWTYGMTGSVSGATAILGVDDSANTTVVSNGLVSQILTFSNTVVSANVFRTNQWTTNLAGTPVNGQVRFQGYPGIAFVTNNARNSAFEWEPTNQSVRIGSIGNVGFDNGNIATSNAWENPNIGFMSWGGGSNCIVNAPWSAIMWGNRCVIFTNAGGSFIGGGTNNVISTNSARSFIGGGGTINQGNIIETDCNNSVIVGGSENTIAGGAQHGAILGGQGNQFRSGGDVYAVIAGGLNNTIGIIGETSGGSQKSFVGGGEANSARGTAVTVSGGKRNITHITSDFSVIAGGSSNTIGTASSAGSSHTTISGGSQNLITDSSDYAVIAGGRLNTAGNSSSNAVISGGAFNTCNGNRVFEMILGGERNTVGANYGYAIGTSNTVSSGANWSGVVGLANSISGANGVAVGVSNSVTAASAGAAGTFVTNTTAGSFTVGELISYNTATVVSGSGNGNTNYLLSVTTPMMLMGSSNVNIYGVANTINGKTHSWSVNITNLSADTWGIKFDSGTNRWKFQSWMYGTNAPVVLTNNTLLRLQGESQGTNTLVTYQYFSPAL